MTSSRFYVDILFNHFDETANRHKTNLIFTIYLLQFSQKNGKLRDYDFCEVRIVLYYHINIVFFYYVRIDNNIIVKHTLYLNPVYSSIIAQSMILKGLQPAALPEISRKFKNTFIILQT